MYDIHLSVGDDGESTESRTDPDSQDVAHTDGHGVACPGGVHDHVVSVQGDQTNTDTGDCSKMYILGEINNVSHFFKALKMAINLK